MNRIDDRDCENCPECGQAVFWGCCRCWDDGSGAVGAEFRTAMSARRARKRRKQTERT